MPKDVTFRFIRYLNFSTKLNKLSNFGTIKNVLCFGMQYIIGEVYTYCFLNLLIYDTDNI